jgi:hypothetical protein
MPSRSENSRTDSSDNNFVQTIFWFWIVLLVPGVLLLAGGVYLSFPYSEIAFILGLAITLVPGYYYLSASLEMRRAVTSFPSHMAVITAHVPEDFIGNICSEVKVRGGQMIAMDSRDGIYEIRAQMPVPSMAGFESWLTKVTFGRGSMKRIDVLRSDGT